MAHKNGAQLRKISEPNTPALDTSELRKRANALVGSSSILDGIREPIDMEVIREKIFRVMLADIRSVANWLGFGYVGGGRMPDGNDYIYVPTDHSGGEGFNHIPKGPGFTPYMHGLGREFRYQDRTTFTFENVHLSISGIEYGPMSREDEQIDSIAEVTIDNLKGASEVRTSIDIEYSEQGSIEAAFSRNWENAFNWNLSSSETINIGDPAQMFARGTITLTQGFSLDRRSGGSSSNSQTIQKAIRKTFRNEVTTPPERLGFYQANAKSSKCFVPFKAIATLACSCKIHGFLRWGGGKQFEGQTNYHNNYSGSGERPTFDYVLGGQDYPWWDALRAQYEMNASPWNWVKMFQRYESAKRDMDWFTDNQRVLDRFSFPVRGIIGGVVRSDVSLSSDNSTGADDSSSVE